RRQSEILQSRRFSMPTHDFLLLPEKGGDYSDYMGHFRNPEAIKLDDDIVGYIFDTLKWIPSINPSNPAEWGGLGLNYYGPTVINKPGAATAARIFRLWAALLQEGPETLELTGGFEWTEDPLTDGRYAAVAARRDSVVNTLQAIAELAEAAAGGE